MLITKALHVMSCCCYHKGTYFQANHNRFPLQTLQVSVVVATTNVRIFKQITTGFLTLVNFKKIFRFWSLILIIYLCTRS